MKGWKWSLARILIPLVAFGRERRRALSMGEELGVVGRVLLVLPFDPVRRQQVLTQVFRFRAAFTRWTLDLLVVGGPSPLPEGESAKGMSVVVVTPDDLGPFGLPRRAILQRLRAGAYHLAIDLSMDRHPFVPWLLHCSGIGLRLGVDGAGRMGGRLHNLFIRLKNPEEVMDRLVETLAPIVEAGAA
jgi:hypothetical protein